MYLHISFHDWETSPFVKWVWYPADIVLFLYCLVFLTCVKSKHQSYIKHHIMVMLIYALDFLGVRKVIYFTLGFIYIHIYIYVCLWCIWLLFLYFCFIIDLFLECILVFVTLYYFPVTVFSIVCVLSYIVIFLKKCFLHFSLWMKNAVITSYIFSPFISPSFIFSRCMWIVIFASMVHP